MCNTTKPENHNNLQLLRGPSLVSPIVTSRYLPTQITLLGKWLRKQKVGKFMTFPTLPEFKNTWHARNMGEL